MTFYETLNKHRKEGENDNQFAKRMNLPRQLLHIWKGGGLPSVRRTREVVIDLNLGIKEDKELLNALVEEKNAYTRERDELKSSKEKRSAFSRELKRYRAVVPETGLIESKEKFARRAGVNFANMKLWEKGVRLPSLPLINRIRINLGLTWREFDRLCRTAVGWEDPKEEKCNK